MIGSPSRLRYGFASGRVRVLQARLVSRSRLNRIIAGEDLAEIVTALSETDYGAALREVRDLEQVERMLSDKLGEAYRLLEDSNLPPELSEWFRSRHDFVNLRVLIKGGLGREADVRLSALGTVSAAVAESLVKSHTFSGFPAPLANAANAALAAYNSTEDFEVIDIVLDRHHFNHLLSLANKVKSAWIVKYTQMLIDFANARVVLRGQAQNRGLSYTAARLIPGGRVDEGRWEALAGASDVAGQLIKILPFGTLSTRQADRAARGLRPDDLDLLADTVLRNYLAEADKIPFGPEPVFAYIAARELETKLLRMIVIGRVNGVSSDILRSRVDRMYE